MKPKAYLLLFTLAIASLAFSGCTTQTNKVPPSTEISSPTQFDLQGHRGARGLRPENTLPAFEMALDLEVTTLELDLHLTGDGVVVVIHDDVIGKNCHLPEESRPLAPAPQISRLTLDEVKQYRCNLNPAPAAVWSPEYQTLNTKNIAAAHQAGLPVIPWTVNDPAKMKELIAWGVDGLISDYPDAALEVLLELGLAY